MFEADESEQAVADNTTREAGDALEQPVERETAAEESAASECAAWMRELLR